MARVTDISKGVGAYTTLSKTPKNRAHDNFFLKELQDKFDEEWKYAPNVVTVVYEKEWGTQEFDSVDVRDQRIRSDKGKPYSDDLKRLVFKDIFEKRFKVGSMFRFSKYFDADLADSEKDIWLAVNTVYANPNTSVVVARCNGRLKLRIRDSQGIDHEYSEPAIFNGDLSGVAFYYSQVAVSPQAALVAVLQHNERTATIYTNQRFVIGYDEVFRVKGIDKFYSNETNDPHAVGLMTVYLERVNISPNDELEKGLAYQEHSDVVIDKDPVHSDVTIEWVKPTVFPPSLKSEPTVFQAIVKVDGVEKPEIALNVSYSLANLPSGISPEAYVEYNDLGDNSFSLRRKRSYTGGPITVVVSVPSSSSPDEREHSVSFSLGMVGF